MAFALFIYFKWGIFGEGAENSDGMVFIGEGDIEDKCMNPPRD